MADEPPHKKHKVDAPKGFVPGLGGMILDPVIKADYLEKEAEYNEQKRLAALPTSSTESQAATIPKMNGMLKSWVPHSVLKPAASATANSKPQVGPAPIGMAAAEGTVVAAAANATPQPKSGGKAIPGFSGKWKTLTLKEVQELPGFKEANSSKWDAQQEEKKKQLKAVRKEKQKKHKESENALKDYLVGPTQPAAQQPQQQRPVDFGRVYLYDTPSNIREYRGSQEQEEGERADWSYFTHSGKSRRNKEVKVKARSEHATVLQPPQRASPLFQPTPRFFGQLNPTAEELANYYATKHEAAASHVRRPSSSASASGSVTRVASSPQAASPPKPGHGDNAVVKAAKAKAQAAAAAARAKAAGSGASRSVNSVPPSTNAVTQAAANRTSVDTPPSTYANAGTTAPAPVVQAPWNGAMITRAPVYYDRSDAQVGQLDRAGTQPEPVMAPTPSASNQMSSGMPGKTDFAQRMMKKMGWQEGTGLGANGEGILTPLQHQAQKRKKRSNQVGGGWATPAMGKITGGKKRKVEPTDQGPSRVIKIKGMLKGKDVQWEVEENNLQQVIGEHFAEFGKLERVLVWTEFGGGDNSVFIKFAEGTAALNAAQETQGMSWKDSDPVDAMFWDVEKFEKGIYA